MDTTIISTTTIAWLGFAIGLLYGIVARHTNFCTMGAISDIINMGEWTRFRSWIFAIAVAIIGVALLQSFGLFSTDRAFYTAPKLLWLSHIVGGLMFGVGMTLSSGCGAKTLIRIGGGNLKSVVVFLTVGFASYMSLRGIFGVARVEWLEKIYIQLPTTQDLPHLLSHSFGLSTTQNIFSQSIAFILGGLLMVYCFKSPAFRSKEALLAGFGTGILVVAGWFITGHLGFVAEHPDTLQEAFVGTNSGRAESLNFIAAFAYVLELLSLWSDKSRFVSFGVAISLGVVLGALCHALATQSFRLEGFKDERDLLRHLIGSVLMGVGAVTAMGCSIGQGITGVSTLAVGSILTLMAIIAGTALALRYQMWRMMRET